MRDRKNFTKNNERVTLTPQIIKNLNEYNHNCKKDLKKKTKEILHLLL